MLSPKVLHNSGNAIAQKAVIPEERKTFKSEFELRIKANEIRITELNVKIKKPEERFDALYEKKIATLEQQNKEMRARGDFLILSIGHALFRLNNICHCIF